MTGVIVHEWIEPQGGAERVLAAIAAQFPDAPIACAWDDTQGTFAPGRTHEGPLARTPLRRSKALALPAMLVTWRRVDLRDADWVLCSSHLFAHHARLRGPARDAPKLVYAHTPARYLWAPEADVRGANPVVRASARPLRVVDRRRAQEPLAIAANSAFIARRIARCWGRDATVIYPPVDVGAFAAQPTLTSAEREKLVALPAEFVLGASRLVAYKQVDRAITAGNGAGIDVVIAGDGPDLERLRAIAAHASVRVIFVGRPSPGMLLALYQRSLAFVFGAVEDFGIMPVEAMAAGTPVVARAEGGTGETVLDGVSGALVHEDTPAAWADAVDRAMRAAGDDCQRQAQRFDGRDFGERIETWMGEALSRG